MKYILFLLCCVSGVLTAQQDSFTWKEFVLGSPSLSIEVPGIVVPQESTLPQGIAAYVEKYEGYYLEDKAKGMVITLMHLKYAGQIYADLAGAANGTISQWEATGAKVDVQLFTKQITADRNSVIQKGLFTIDGKQSIFTNLVIGEEANMWQIVMIVPANDDTMKKAMDRLYASIKSK